MKNIKLTSVKPDFRVACIFDDVSKLKLDGVSVVSNKNNPAIILNKVKEYLLNRLKLPTEISKSVKVQ